MTPEQKRTLRILILKLLLEREGRLHVTNQPQPQHTSILSGAEFVKEIIEGSPRVCYELLRMEKHAFLRLCVIFKEKGWLKDSRFISVEEKMAMFIITISHNIQNRLVKNRFQHSGETVSKYFNDVLLAMLCFAKEMIVSPSFDQIPKQISTNEQYRECFKGAIGAIDGTLIHASIPLDEQTPYRGRGKGECYQNVMALCNFDMIFMYVQPGWEGVAHDSRILLETISDSRFNFPIPPPDKYYLVDAAYTNMRGFLAPYRNTRYWLKDFRSGGRPRSKEEMFNHAHARLRNVIERSFGVLKARFPILKAMPPYSFPIQRNIVIACVTIHNYIRRYGNTDSLFRAYEDEAVRLETSSMEMDNTSIAAEEIELSNINYMSFIREKIANYLFQHQ